MAEQEMFTLDDLHLVRVPSGRCPHCGRPSSASEAKVFAELREAAASAAVKEQRAEGRVASLRDERDQLKVRNADLRAENKELRKANG